MPAVTDLGELEALAATTDTAPAPFTADPDAIAAAAASLAETGMVMLGEVHGVRQTPAQLARLVELLDIRTLVFEWPVELTGTVERFRAGGRLDDHPLLWLGDGRLTAGHLALLRRLHADRPGLRWLAFDGWTAPPWRPGEDPWTARDRRMADRLLAAVEVSDRALVVAGNLRTRLDDVPFGTPMGAWIARHRPGLGAITIRYGRGWFYNSGSSASHAERPLPGSRLHLLDGGPVLDLPAPQEADVPHRPGDHPECRPAGRGRFS